MRLNKALLLATLFVGGTSVGWSTNTAHNDENAAPTVAVHQDQYVATIHKGRVAKGKYKSTPSHTKEVLSLYREGGRKKPHPAPHPTPKPTPTPTPTPTPSPYPAAFDFSQYATQFDQGDLGSCTANALSGGFFVLDVLEEQANDNNQHTVDIYKSKIAPLSRLMIYYNERAMEGSVTQDAGASIGDGVNSLITQGACPETEWPYDITKFTVRPPAQAYADALHNRVLSSLNHDSIDPSNGSVLNLIKQSLIAKQPLAMGIMLYPEFESDAVAANGMVPMPSNPNPSNQIGGHAVLAVGYNDANQTVTFKNSWGAGWGDNGNFHLPYAYFDPSRQWVDEIWQLGSVTQPTVTFSVANDNHASVANDNNAPRKKGIAPKGKKSKKKGR